MKHWVRLSQPQPCGHLGRVSVCRGLYCALWDVQQRCWSPPSMPGAAPPPPARFISSPDITRGEQNGSQLRSTDSDGKRRIWRERVQVPIENSALPLAGLEMSNLAEHSVFMKIYQGCDRPHEAWRPCGVNLHGRDARGDFCSWFWH